MELIIQKGGITMTNKKLLNKVELADALFMSYSTLWRSMKNNGKKAKKLKLKQCPVHVNYNGGRKYYIAKEVREWMEYISQF